MNVNTGELRYFTNEEIKQLLMDGSPWKKVPDKHKEEAQQLIESSHNPVYIDPKADTPLSDWAKKIIKPKRKKKRKRKIAKASKRANR